MKVILSAQAEADLGEILADISAHFPGSYPGFEARLRAILAHIGRWPEAAQRLENRNGVRMVAMMRYPYNVFYTVSDGTVEILHILHGARQPRAFDPR